ncbi:metalloregulator ArsR/SmtB family transcription factor [Kiloniella sp. EL199]|uniref:helix-turn-helix transcriptional regulator n=1 Tax=Kiloniella sp. EL199 TaxID=2107581 RepID=UPI000EA3FC75|nr:metalloregulator ArsR/SmtB family transcription factor [Kiloniella sp. EL199]
MKKNAKTEDAILALLKARGAMQAVDLAKELSMTAIGMRQHLKRMSVEGMIQKAIVDVTSSRASSGAGRPAVSWELTAESHNAFGDSHALLTRDLIESARAVFGDQGVDQLVNYREQQTLESYTQALSEASSLEDRVQKLVVLREQEGYMASAEADNDGGFLFIENHCPICTAATICQGFCRAELSVFRAVLGPDVEVERAEYLLEGGHRCSYFIRPKDSRESNQFEKDKVSEKEPVKNPSPQARYLIVEE